MYKNKFLKRLITVVFLLINVGEIFANTLILDPNSKYNTKLDKSNTDIPIVNISTPNNRGISVNEFLEYNIGKEGQILNNADNVGRSHLAGLINSNPNLGANQAANLIVLQVNGSNRSQIEGYLEALSRKKVNVILSNENGIYLDNSGTINIQNFTLTTGKVKLKDGDFIGIDVNRGNIAIGPKGLDFTKADYVEILSKTLELTGNLVAEKDLKIVTGSNKFDKDGNFEKMASSSPVSVAIDASNLGGMYANQIKIISTDKGAGVNSNAFVVSKNNKLEITADGKVKVNKIQGNGIDIKAQNYEQTGFAHSDSDIKIKADSIKLSGDGTQAEQKITLDGNVENNSAIYTKENLYTKNLKNTSNIEVLKNIEIDGSLNNSNIIQAKDINIVGNNLINSLNIKAENITVNLNNIKNDGEILALNDIRLNTKKLDNTRKIAALQNIVANNTVLTNDGEIVSNKSIRLIDSDISNSNKILSNTIEIENAINFNNIGTINGTDVTLTTKKDINLIGNLHGENSLIIQGNSIINNGNTTGKNSISIKANNFINSKELSSQNLELNIGENILNESILNARDLNIKAKNLMNNDLIASENNLTIAVENTLTNSETKTIYSGNNLNIKAKKILNEKAELIGESINLEAEHIKNNVGSIQAQNDIIIKAEQFENIGEVKDLDKYESYYETFNGEIIEANDINNWKKRYSHSSSKRSNGSAGRRVREAQRKGFINIVKKVENDPYESLLFPKYTNMMRSYLGNSGHYYERTGSAKIQEIPLKEKLRSLGKTTYAKIMAGNNVTITSNDVLNKDAIISAKNTVKIETDKLENLVSVSDEKIKVKTGQESMFIKYERTGRRHKRKVHGEVTYVRDFANDYVTKRIPKLDENGNIIYRRRQGIRRPVYENVTEYVGRYAYVAGEPSIIEAKNINVGAANLIKQDIEEKNGIIRENKSLNIPEIEKKEIRQGSSKNLEIFSNLKEIEDIIKSGKIDTISNLPSSLFIKNLEPTAKYLMETRVKHISLSHYYGSDYFLEKVGYKDKKDKYDRVQRLGDAFYENQLVERSIIEKLGARFLNGRAFSMKDLIDNAEIEAKKQNLTIGIALTKEQISNLNKDIIWYEYQDVSGLKVLAPKIYLSKNTLANINSDGRSRIDGTELTSIKAKTIDNKAIVGNKGTTYVEADSIINRNIGDQIAEIRGEKTSLVAENDIFNIGSKIYATDELNLIAKNGDILNKSTIIETNRNFNDLNRTRHTELENIAEISSDNKLNINANNYSSTAAITSAKDLNIVAKENVNIGSQKLSGEQKFGKDGDNFNFYAFESNIGSNVNAENLSISANNLNVESSDLVAKKDVNIDTKENINLISNTDSVYTESQSKIKKGFGRGSSSTTINYNENLVKSNIYAGNNINLSSNKNISVVGSDIYALNNVNINSKEDLIIASNLEGNSSINQTKKTGLFKLSGKTKMEDNLKYTNVESVIKAKNDINLVSDKNISIIASNLNSEKNINIKAKENANILAADDKFKAEKKESKYSIKPFASLNGLKFEAGLKGNYSKIEESNFSTKVKGSEIFAKNDINIESANDTNIQASTIISENTNISTKGKLNLLTKDEININNISGTEIEAKLNAKLDLNGIKETVKSVVDVVKGLPELPKVVNVATGLVSGKDLNESLAGNEKGIEQANRMLNGPKSGGVSAGIYASGSIEKTKSTTEIKNSIGSNILSKENINLASDEDIKIKQANIQGKNISINSKKDILIESGLSTVNSKASSQSLNGEIGLLTGEFNIGGRISKDKADEKSHTNSQIYGENIAINSEDLTVKGGNIEAEKIDIKAKDLHIESMQDKANSKHQAISVSAGKSSVGAGIEYGKNEKEWVAKQSSIIGREKSEIEIAEKTNIIGAIIGGADTTLKTKELEYSNIEDKEKGFNIGMNASATISSINIYNEEDPNNPNKKLNISKSGSLNYGAVDREQVNRATIGKGKIIIDGKEENPNINRDENKAQEITKDISVKPINIDYSDNRREWSVASIQDILGEHVKEAIVVPMDSINKKLKLYEKYDFFRSDIDLYKFNIEKDLEGNIKENHIQIPNDSILKKGSTAHLNGMNTDKENAIDETKKFYLKKFVTDVNLEGLERGEKKEFYIFHNKTHGNNSDLYEAAIDKFGVKGTKKIYSDAVKELGEIIWRNRDNIEVQSMFSQANLQYYASLHYIEEKYGVGALKHIRTKKYTSIGSPLNAEELITFLRDKEIIKNPNHTNVEIKNDNLDLVASIVGFNGKSIIKRDPIIENKIKNNEKYGLLVPHSHYSYGLQPNSYIYYNGWQNILIYSDKFLEKLNIKSYFRKKEIIEINKGAERNEKID